MNRKSAFLGCLILLILTLLTSAAFAGVYLSWPTDGALIMPFSPSEHRGIDIAAAVGTRVTAAEEGVVYWVGRTPRGEPCVSIDHPNGHSTSYLPVEASVVKGQKISKGAVIGVLGADGDPSSEEPHLHLGLFETSSRDDKRYLNPQDYLPARLVEPSSDIQTPPAAELNGSRAGAEVPRTVEPQAEQSAVAQPSVAAVGLPVATIAPSAGAASQGALSQNSKPVQRLNTATQMATSGRQTIEVPSTTIQLADLPSKIATVAAGDLRLAQGASSEVSQGLPPVPAILKTASTSYADRLEPLASAGYTSNYQGSAPSQSMPQALPNVVVSGALPAGLESAHFKEIKELQTSGARVGPNPFSMKTADVRATRPPAPVTAGQTGESPPVSTVSKHPVFNSSLLPDLVLACALTLIITVSFRFARRVKKTALSALRETPATSGCAA